MTPGAELKRSREDEDEAEQRRGCRRVRQGDRTILLLPTRPTWDSLSAQARELCNEAMALFDDEKPSNSAKLVPQASDVASKWPSAIDSRSSTKEGALQAFCPSGYGVGISTQGHDFVPSVLSRSSTKDLRAFGPSSGYDFPTVDMCGNGFGSSLTPSVGSHPWSGYGFPFMMMSNDGAGSALPAGSENARPRAILKEASALAIFQARPSKSVGGRDFTLASRLAEHYGVTATTSKARSSQTRKNGLILSRMERTPGRAPRRRRRDQPTTRGEPQVRIEGCQLQ